MQLQHTHTRTILNLAHAVLIKNGADATTGKLQQIGVRNKFIKKFNKIPYMM